MQGELRRLRFAAEGLAIALATAGAALAGALQAPGPSRVEAAPASRPRDVLPVALDDGPRAAGLETCRRGYSSASSAVGLPSADASAAFAALAAGREPARAAGRPVSLEAAICAAEEALLGEGGTRGVAQAGELWLVSGSRGDAVVDGSGAVSSLDDAIVAAEVAQTLRALRGARAPASAGP